METMDQFKLVKNERILIDTNILVYCGDNDFGLQAKKLLRILKDNKNNLAVSHASCFELIKNAIDDKLREYYFSLLDYMDNLPITQEIVASSAFLYHTYLKSGMQSAKKIESFDLIISGTVTFHKGALLLTANRQDFPMPFWINVAQGYIMYKVGENYQLINIFLLKFDYSLISKKDKVEM